MVKFLQASKKAGLFRKEQMLSAVVTLTEQSIADEDVRVFREGFTTWIRRYGSSAKDLLLVFMADDEKQEAIFSFFRLALADAQVADGLSRVQVRLQFPSMSQNIADQTHARIMAGEL